MLRQGHPGHPSRFALLVLTVILGIDGCMTAPDVSVRNKADEARRAIQLTQEREQALAELRAEVASTRIAAAKQEAELQTLRTAVTQLRQENSESQQALFEARRMLDVRQTELAAVKTERDHLEQAHTQSGVSERTLATLQDQVASLSQELTQLKQTVTVVAQKAVAESAIRRDSSMDDDNQAGPSGHIVPAMHVLREPMYPSAPSRITVQPGDSWWSLARKHKTTIETLRAVNGRVGDHVTVGEALRLP